MNGNVMKVLYYALLNILHIMIVHYLVSMVLLFVIGILHNSCLL